LGGTIRAQSETLGILVIVGVVLVLAAAMAVFLLTDTGTQEEPRLSNVEIDATVDLISVRHEGGDRLNSEDIEVIVVTEGDRSEVNLLDDFSYRQPTVANEFQAGDEFARADGPYVGDVTVLVVHEPTETIIADEEFSIEPDMIVRINSISSANSGGSSLSTASEDSALTTDTETDLSVGDDVNVTFSIENKDVSDTFDLTVTFDDNVVNNTNVALEPGDNKTRSVTGNADLTDGLEVEVDVEYGLGYEPLAGPNFDVDFSYSLNSSSANVTYGVTNTGDIGHNQTLEIESLSSGGTIEVDNDTESVTLSGGESHSDTFTDIAVEANGELVLSSGNDTVTKEVSGGEFDVTSLESSDISFNPPDGGDAVWAGDNVTVDYKVTNVAEIADSTEVALEVNGSVANTTTTPVVPSEDTATGTLKATVPRDIAPFAQLTISTADDGSASGVDVYLPDPPNFEVDIDVPEPANDAIFYEEESQTVDVDVTINNTGEVNDTQTIELDAGFDTYSRQIYLDRGVGGGEEKTREFSVTPESGDAGEYTFSVSSNNDTDSADAQVFEELPDLIASLEDAEGSVGETVDVGLDVVELGASASNIKSYSFALSFNGSVANLTEIKGDELPTTANINNSSGAASAAEFGISDTPPFEPGLILNAELLADGTSAIEFNDSIDLEVGNQKNEINKPSLGETYDVVYENATLNGSEPTTATVATARSTVGSAATPLNINEDSVTEDSSISSTQAPTPSTDAPQVLPELTANLSEVEGSVGETVGVELNVSSFGGAGDDTFGSYSFVLSYNDQVLEFDSVEGGAWSDPYIVNEEENAVALADFDVSGSTPAAPALTFNFEIVDTGMSEISFDDSVAGIPAENTIYDESARAYSINFENGGAGTGGTPLDPTSFVSGHTITPSAAVDELPDYPVGDADESTPSDGVAITDASKIAEFVVGIPPEDPFDENLANVTREAPTGGTGVNIGDAQRIAQFVVNQSFAPQANLTAFAPTETITIGDSLTETVNVTNNGGMGTIQEVFYRIQDENGNDVFNESINLVDLAIDGFEGNETDVTVAVTPDTSIDAGEYTQQIITKGIPPKSGIAIEDSSTTALTIEPDDPGSVSVVTQPQDTTAGETVEGPPAVNVTDQYGNPVPGETVEVSANGPDSVVGGPQTAVTNGSGIATFDTLNITAAGSYTLTFDAENVSDSQGGAVDSESFEITSAEQASVTVETQPTDTTAGEIVGGLPAANVTDAFGNAVESVDVTVTSDAGIAEGQTTVATGADGIATFDDLNITTAGTTTLTFNAGGVDENATTGEFEITAAAVDSVEITPGAGQTVAAGEELAFSAEAFDEFGNVNESSDSAFNWDASDGSITGDGLFNTTVADESGTDYDVTAAIDGVSSAPTTVTVEPAAVAGVTISPASNKTITAGETVGFSATATDKFENVNESSDSAFSWDASGGSIAGDGLFEEASAAESGSDYDVTATLAGVTSGTTTVTVEPGDVVAVGIDPGTTQTLDADAVDAGNLDFDVTAVDEFDNVVEDGDTAFDFGGPVDTSGVFQETTAGTYTVNATEPGSGVSSTDVSVEVTAGDAASVSVDTQPQDTTAGQIISGPPAAKVTDQHGNPVSGVDVTVSESGGYTFDSGTTTQQTGGNGVATFSDLVIETAGDYTLTFDAAGDSATTASFVVTAASANSVSVDTQPQDTTAGQSIGGSPAAKVTDEFGNPVSGVDVSVTASGPGSIASGTTTVSTDASGVASFGNIVIETAGDYTLTFDATGVSTTVDSAQFTVSAASANSVSVDTQPQDTTAGNTIGGSPAAKVIDEFGNPVSGVDVSVSASGGSLDSGTTPVSTDSNGVAAFGDLVIETAGDYTLTFDASGVGTTVDSAQFTVTAASANSVSVETQPQDTTAGQSIGGPAAAKVIDEFGNPVSGVDVTVSESGGYTFDSGTTTQQTDGSGVATFGDLVIETKGSYSLEFSAAGDSATTSSFSITAASVSTVTISPSSTTVEPSTSNVVDFSAQAVDQYGNVITDSDSDFTWTATGGSVDGSGSYDSPSSSGTETVTATYNSGPSADATVTVQAPANFAVTITNAPDVVEGDDLSVEVFIENTGDVQDTQTITLDAGSLGTNSTQLTLGGGDSQFVTLSVGTGSGDAGSYNPTMSSADDSASASVQVKEPADFGVQITNAPDVVEGEDMSVEAYITNNGGVSDTQTITLSSNLGTNSTQITLGSGNSQFVTLSVGTGNGDAGSYNPTMSSENDSASASVQVKEPADFSLSFSSLPGTITQGQNLDVSVQVTNNGDASGSTDVTVNPGDLGNSKTTSSGSVGAGGSTTVSFTFETTKNDGGRSYTVSASESTTSGSASGSVTVDQPIIDFTVRLQNDGDSKTGSTEVYVDESPNRYDDAVRVYGGGSGVVGHSFLYSATGVSAERLFGTQENDSAEGEKPPERDEQNDSSEEDEVSPGPGYPGLPDEPTSSPQLTEEEKEELAEDRQEEDNQFDESNVQTVNPDDVEGNRITLDEPGVYATSVSGYDYVKIELEGPGGGASEAGDASTDENAGGDGGFVTAVWSVSYDNTVTTTVGDGGDEGDTYGDVGDGGSGYHDGGKGGYDDVFGGGTAAGGGGGGSTVAEIDGDVSAIAGGGGGGGAVNTGYTVVDSAGGGGGGGNDGSGGDGDGGSNDGESASSGNIGSSTYGGYGGDAYDGTSNTAYPGGDGGWAYYSAISGSGSTGGGEDGGSPSENDGDDGSATVILPDISASGSAPNTVQPGESVTIGYTLSNSADVRGKEDDVDLYLDGSYEGDDGSVIVSANGDESGTLPSFTPNSEGYSGGDTINYEIDLDDFPSGDYTGTIDVAQPPPDPQVTNIRGPSSVEAGNTITFKIDIENFGGDMSSGENLDVDLDSDCCPPNEPGSPTLSAGESDTIYWDYDTSSSDTPEVVAWAGFGGVSAGDSGAESKSVTVNDPPDPQVTDIDANPSSGTPGDTVTFDITVKNFGGDMSSSEDVDIDLENAAGGIGYAGDVQLSGGQTTSVTEDYTLQSGDASSFTAWSGVGNIQTGDGESVTVSVDDPAYFDVRIDNTNSPVVEGSTLNVDVEITNTGDVSDNQDIDLSIPGLGSDSTSVSLSGGQTKTETLSVGTGGGDAGSYTAQASSDDDSYSQGVQVDEPAFFDVSIQSTNSPVEGNDLDVTVKIENTGDRSGTQTINLDVPGLGSDSTGVFLSGGNSKTRTLSVGTSGGDAGSYTAQVSSDDDSVSQGVQVKAPADLQVKSLNFPSEIIAGNTLNIDVTVENTGDVSGSDTIELVIDGTVEDSIPVSVGGNSETTKEVSYEQTSSVVQALVDAGLVDIVDEEGEESNAESVPPSLPSTR